MADYELWCNIAPLAAVDGALFALFRVEFNLLALVVAMILFIISISIILRHNKEQGIRLASFSFICDIAWFLVWLALGYLPYSFCPG